MKSCFCGCGRTISRFPLGRRSINRRGDQVAKLLASMKADAGDDPNLATWYAEGDSIVAELESALHGDLDPRSLDESPVRHWQKTGREIEAQRNEMYGRLGQALNASGMSPEEAASELGRLIHEEGMSPEEATRALGLAPPADRP